MSNRRFIRRCRIWPLGARLAGLAVLLVLLAGSAAAGTDVWASHITAADGWKTSISMFNPTYNNPFGIQYTLHKYGPDGSHLGSESGTVEHGSGWSTIPPETLNYEGSAHIVSDDNLVVKLAYQFGDTPSVCEFYLKGGVQTQWILPNSVRPWMDWTGLAVINTGDASVDITVAAHKDGVPVAVMAAPVTLAPQAKYVRLSDQIWAGIGYTDADTFVVTASAPIQAPLSITGNHAQDRHLFFAAQPSTPIQDPLVGTPAGTDVWASHITAAAGWRTEISVYNPGLVNGDINLYRYDEAGADLGAQADTVAPNAWRRLDGAWLQYEGSAHITSNRYLLVKLEFQYGDTPSVCEFYLAGGRYHQWVLPNAVRSWMDWTGLAAVNTDAATQELVFVSYLDHIAVGYTSADVEPRAKLVRLTNGIWPDVGYRDLDTASISCPSIWEGRMIAAPISITGNTAQDRHLFFAAQPMPPNESGATVWADDIVGLLYYGRHESFDQGSLSGEPCRGADETPFTHALGRNFAMMEYEVTRGMWAALQAVQPSLPADPSHLWGGDADDQPVQRVTWPEAVLFANLLSAHRNLKPCYYTDAAFTVPVTAANYTAGPFFCDFDAPGFRLPTEGEWEYVCRGGFDTNPFPNRPYFMEDNYSAANCGAASAAGMYPTLETLAWFAANSGGRTSPVGFTIVNPWGQLDLLGNVWEWCWDWYAAYPAGAVTDYAGPGSGTQRVVRGGAWDRDARDCRACNRESYSPDTRLNSVGFRLVRTYP